MTVRFHSLSRVATATAAAAIVLGLTAQTAAADPDVDSIEAEIEEKAAELALIIEDYNAAAEDLDDLQGQIEDLEEEIAPYQTELDELYDQNENLSVSLYQQQGMAGAAALLNSGSPDAFAARAAALNGLTAADAAAAEEVIDLKEELDEDLAELQDMRDEADDLAGDLEQTAEEIDAGIAELQDDRREIYQEEGVDYVPDYVPGDRGVVVRFALDQKGKPYQWGSSGPSTYDCSGLIMTAYSQIGVSLPHNAARQYSVTARVSRDQLQPADLVFYNGLGHAGLYIGEGYVIHAPQTGDVVKINPIDEVASSYYGAGRVL